MTSTTQEQRTAWRSIVMKAGGTEYLNEKSRLFDYSEKLTCPTMIGLPLWLRERVRMLEVRG